MTGKVRAMIDGILTRFRPVPPAPSEVETTSDEEKARITSDREQLRRELAHYQMRAIRLATEARQRQRSDGA